MGFKLNTNTYILGILLTVFLHRCGLYIYYTEICKRKVLKDLKDNAKPFLRYTGFYLLSVRKNPVSNHFIFGTLLLINAELLFVPLVYFNYDYFFNSVKATTSIVWLILLYLGIQALRYKNKKR